MSFSLHRKVWFASFRRQASTALWHCKLSSFEQAVMAVALHARLKCWVDVVVMLRKELSDVVMHICLCLKQPSSFCVSNALKFVLGAHFKNAMPSATKCFNSPVAFTFQSKNQNIFQWWFSIKLVSPKWFWTRCHHIFLRAPDTK